MGCVMLGIAVATEAGITGATAQMFSHGLIAGLLFLLAGWVYERAHACEMAEFGGIAKITFGPVNEKHLGMPDMTLSEAFSIAPKPPPVVLSHHATHLSA